MRTALIVIFLIIIGTFYFGGPEVQSLISPYISLKSLPFVNEVPTFTPTPSPESIPAPTVDYSDKIVATGDFQFSGYKIKYTFITPKSGGSVSGSLEGVCVGSPNGTYDGQNSISGEFTAKCTAGPLNLINIDIDIKYTGTVHQSEGKMNIQWESTSPTTERGSFDLYFNPSSQSNTTTSIRVTAPNGGESFKVGDLLHITWNSNNLTKNGSCIATLQYSDGTSSTTWIPVNTPQGAYDWKITSDSAGKQARVNLECYDPNQTRVTDQSDNFFIIQ